MIAKVLPLTKITSLKCASPLVYGAPNAMHDAAVDAYSISSCACSCMCSLGGNNIGDYGAAEIAELLPQTEITSLKCASPVYIALALKLIIGCVIPGCARVRACLCSLFWNHIGDVGAMAIAKVLPQSRITSLKCASPLHEMTRNYVCGKQF